jgi:hypothetical protein
VSLSEWKKKKKKKKKKSEAKQCKLDFQIYGGTRIRLRKPKEN